MFPKLKLYIVVRTDLKTSSPAAQACHAAVEAGASIEYVPLLKEWFLNHKTLVVLRAVSKEQLQELRNYLDSLGCIIFDWREADLDDELTAIAVAPRTDLDLSEILSGFPLLGSKK